MVPVWDNFLCVEFRFRADGRGVGRAVDPGADVRALGGGAAPGVGGGGCGERSVAQHAGAAAHSHGGDVLRRMRSHPTLLLRR